jgi:hypothetical protein
MALPLAGVASTTTPLVTTPGGAPQSDGPSLGTMGAVGTMGAAPTKDSSRRIRVAAAIAASALSLLGMTLACGALLALSRRNEPWRAPSAPSSNASTAPEQPEPTLEPLAPPGDPASADRSTSPTPPAPTAVKPPDIDTSYPGTDPPARVPAQPPIEKSTTRRSSAAGNPCAGKTAFLLKECEKKHRHKCDPSDPYCKSDL